MKGEKMTYYLCLLTATAILLSGCAIGECQPQKGNCIMKPAQMETFEGENKTLGNGTVYSWVTLDTEGNPSSIGVNFTESALEELPEAVVEYAFDLPEEAASTAYDHVGIDWNPAGHDPHGIYDKPHFDFHFYMISPEERDKITASDKDSEKLSKEPVPGYIPEGYVSTPGGVPRMGAHWIDPEAPEFKGQPFNETFIYGFYNGKMVFVEPMVTIAFLEAKPEITKELKLPKCYPAGAYYPTNYSISYNEASKAYTVALENLTLR
ncbi:hypothetical protein EQO05_04610 [Methanosarcina sp. MSH10X1]|uniref:DUF5602 domain-containing protein n=1 Tax=Methanosarcina sp. MSH10X1 TaxID=2507075 RepID=UPI000FFC8F72|nr:DUF5602 domain-containing protein [Methanosarcina sp. MSH10X1]RXA20424.1 hypothetical protein EQO05_04610 [Methanosarcina sp. MSH10X1]